MCNLSWIIILFICSFADCPAIRSPHQPGPLTSCSPTASCTGIQCCVPVDIEVDILYINVWLTIDPCNYTLSVGIGRWNVSATLTRTDFGTRRKVDISRAWSFMWVYAKIIIIITMCQLSRRLKRKTGERAPPMTFSWRRPLRRRKVVKLPWAVNKWMKSDEVFEAVPS